MDETDQRPTPDATAESLRRSDARTPAFSASLPSRSFSPTLAPPLVGGAGPGLTEEGWI